MSVNTYICMWMLYCEVEIDVDVDSAHSSPQNISFGETVELGDDTEQRHDTAPVSQYTNEN